MRVTARTAHLDAGMVAMGGQERVRWHPRKEMPQIQ